MSKLKLYCVSGACSISPHIALREAELPFDLDRLDLKGGKKTEDGRDFLAISPKGSVPALIMENGEVLTEGVAIVQYIADLKPASKLAPPPGSLERLRLQEWLNFIATELHKGTSPLMSQLASPEYKAAVQDRLVTRSLAYLDQHLAKQPYLMGASFTVADGYLLYGLRTCRRLEVPLTANHIAFIERVSARPHVKAALEAEGLTP